MITLTTVIAAIIIGYTLRTIVLYRNALKGIGHLPGHRIPIAPWSLLGMIIRRIPGALALGVTVQSNVFHEWGYDVYIKDGFGWDIRSFITMFPGPLSTYLLVADAAAVKEISSSRARFPKAIVFYDVLSFLGDNVVTTEGEQWKRSRKIAAGAFSERNNKLVWQETVRVMNGLFEGEWKDRERVDVDHCLDLTLPISLFVISSAAFGQTISWENNNSNTIPLNHTMSFKEAIQILSKDFLIPVALPEWLLGATRRTREAGEAMREVRTYLMEMIQGRLDSEKVERHDLLSILLEENLKCLDGSGALTDDELIGNMFLFMVAGHETTSHTLAYTLGLLALYPDEQEELFQHITTVLDDGRTPTYADISSLIYVFAVLQESLRLYPPVSAYPKVAAQDTTLRLQNEKGETKSIPVPKGTFIDIHVTGMHYNPRYWKDPKIFNPARFMDPNWPRDAFIPFSAGSRACLGRRFAEIESIIVLTMLVAKYKVTIQEEKRFENETVQERRERVMESEYGLSQTPKRIPLVFTRRSA